MCGFPGLRGSAAPTRCPGIPSYDTKNHESEEGVLSFAFLRTVSLDAAGEGDTAVRGSDPGERVQGVVSWEVGA